MNKQGKYFTSKIRNIRSITFGAPQREYLKLNDTGISPASCTFLFTQMISSTVTVSSARTGSKSWEETPQKTSGHPTECTSKTPPKTTSQDLANTITSQVSEGHSCLGSADVDGQFCDDYLSIIYWCHVHIWGIATHEPDDSLGGKTEDVPSVDGESWRQWQISKMYAFGVQSTMVCDGHHSAEHCFPVQKSFLRLQSPWVAAERTSMHAIRLQFGLNPLARLSFGWWSLPFPGHERQLSLWQFLYDRPGQ